MTTAPAVAAIQPGQAVRATAPAMVAAGQIGLYGGVSLYVGDLEPSVNEGQLFDVFSQVGPVVSVRVCRDQTRRVSLGYAYINYTNPQDAASALELLNYTPINGKPIRIMYSQRDPSLRKSGYANVFIKNLDPIIDNKALLETFGAFGTVLSCKIALDSNGRSKGYAFVQYDKEEAAHSAISCLNGMLINERKVFVGLFIRRQDRIRANGSPKFTNVFVKNISENVSDEDLKNIFGAFGSITSTVVMKDGSGKSRCFGFVNFENPDAAANAVEKLNGTTHDDKVWYVGRAQKKSEREAELRAKFEQERISRYEKFQGANLYMKNLDDSINDDKLKELFSEFGAITSCKVMVDANGASKGSGFVAFSNPEEAARALNEMNGKMVGKKPLYVAVAQRKDERKARLQAHFAQVQVTGGVSPMSPGMPSFNPGAPRLSPPQLYFGQGNHGLVPPLPAGYGFQQQMLPGIRPGVAPNFIMPYPVPRQNQPGQRMGTRRGGNAQHLQPQMANRNTNQGFRYLPNGRNGMDSHVMNQGLVGSMMPLPFEGSGISRSPTDLGSPGQLSTSLITSTLASASPEQQRLMLGEKLYPLVEHLEHDNAGKVTGMLLEMDQPEVLHLIESPDALKKKVAEAMEVLRSASLGADINGQLGSLSLTK